MSDDLLNLEALASQNDDDLLRLFTDRIADLLSHQPDHLMSMLYRLDVAEHAVHLALHNEQDPAQALAQLVIDRQRQRLATKARYRQEPLEDF